MKHGSLFTGVAGFDLAASWLDWENIFQVENDKFCIKVLEKNFPNTKRYGDIKEFDGTEYRGIIDILTGGFPCQSFSVAGKQRGKSDTRWLWPQMLRIIREIQPPYVIGENVPGIIKLALEDICASLESEGYAVQPFVIPSASIGAWDKRERVWIIGYNNKFRCNNEQKRPIETIQNKIRINEIKEQGRREQQCRISESNFILTDTKSTIGEQPRETWTGGNGCANEIRRNGQANWSRDWVEVASELCGSNARVSSRMDRIKALGNSVNPHVVFEIFKAIESIIKSTNNEQNKC